MLWSTVLLFPLTPTTLTPITLTLTPSQHERTLRREHLTAVLMHTSSSSITGLFVILLVDVILY
jgi:hypothetical protein